MLEVTDEDDDSDLLHLYRAQAHQMPPAALDARILAAARASEARRKLWLLLPLMAAAAASVLIVRPMRHEPQTQSRPLARYVPGGLYEGQATQQLADPQLMRQQAIMQMPGGSDGERQNGS